MTQLLLRHRLSLSFAVFALMAVPGVCATITVSSSLSPNPLLLPDQTLAYLGNNNQSVTVGSGTFTLGSFQSTITTNPTPTPSFTLTLTDSVDATPLVFKGSFAVVGGNDTLSLSGTGTETIGGVTFATIADAGYLYGVQQSTVVNLGKGTPVISSIVASVPEPAAFFLCGLGLLAFAGVRRNRRKDI
jgi:hypothetical protein